MGLRLNFAIISGVLFALTFIFFLLEGSFTGKVVEQTDGSIEKFVECLNKKGVVMYGFVHNPSVEAQLALFGVHVLNLKVIDCHENPEKCTGVIVYPSWKIDKRIISSGLSLGVLSDLSGCKL